MERGASIYYLKKTDFHLSKRNILRGLVLGDRYQGAAVPFSLALALGGVSSSSPATLFFSVWFFSSWVRCVHRQPRTWGLKRLGWDMWLDFWKGLTVTLGTGWATPVLLPGKVFPEMELWSLWPEQPGRCSSKVPSTGWKLFIEHCLRG